jgi:hypothetical protein
MQNPVDQTEAFIPTETTVINNGPYRNQSTVRVLITYLHWVDCLAPVAANGLECQQMFSRVHPRWRYLHVSDVSTPAYHLSKQGLVERLLLQTFEFHFLRLRFAAALEKQKVDLV